MSSMQYLICNVAFKVLCFNSLSSSPLTFVAATIKGLRVIPSQLNQCVRTHLTDFNEIWWIASSRQKKKSHFANSSKSGPFRNYPDPKNKQKLDFFWPVYTNLAVILVLQLATTPGWCQTKAEMFLFRSVLVEFLTFIFNGFYG